jgi:hypothetical protein
MAKKLPPSQRPERQRPERPEDLERIKLHPDQTVKDPLLEVSEEQRNRIVGAAQRAVATFDNDGGGLCVHYAIAGWYLITKYLKLPCSIQCGTLLLQADPEDPTLLFAIDGDREDSVRNGEFHAWIGTQTGVFIDLSAKDWPDLVEGKVGQLILLPDGSSPSFRYRRPHLNHIWSAWNRTPDWIHMRPIEAPTRWVQSMLATNDESLADLKHFFERVEFFYQNPDAALVTPSGVYLPVA